MTFARFVFFIWKLVTQGENALYCVATVQYDVQDVLIGFKQQQSIFIDICFTFTEERISADEKFDQLLPSKHFEDFL